jgi:hypothetical protein
MASAGDEAGSAGDDGDSAVAFPGSAAATSLADLDDALSAAFGGTGAAAVAVAGDLAFFEGAGVGVGPLVASARVARSEGTPKAARRASRAAESIGGGGDEGGERRRARAKW